MRDVDIDYSDIPLLDADVLAWLKGRGRGYQTRINRILRVVMESQPPRRA